MTLWTQRIYFNATVKGKCEKVLTDVRKQVCGHRSAEVTFTPLFYQPKLVLDLATLEGGKAELT